MDRVIGIIELRLGGIIYSDPSKVPIFQHNAPGQHLGFEVLERGNVKLRHYPAFKILYHEQEAYILESDAGEFFEKPKLSITNEDI